MILFLGDSITAWWDEVCFNKYFGNYNPINLGISGHNTRHTLDYIRLCKLNNMQPKVVVLQIGTNNSDHGMTTHETVEDIKEILNVILEYIPNTNILLVGPLPRGMSPLDKYRVFNNEVNKMLRKVPFDLRVQYIDVGYILLQSSGTISSEIMHDMLHLTRKGYEILSDHLSSFVSLLHGP